MNPHARESRRRRHGHPILALATLIALAAVAPQPVPGGDLPLSPAWQADSPPVTVAIPPAAELLARIRPDHPRVMATAADFKDLKRRIASDRTLANLFEAQKQAAERALRTQVKQRRGLPNRMWQVSTSASIAYQVTGDRRYLEGLWRHLEASAKIPTWGPRRFLDTARMMGAFAIAYDWNYDAWSPQQRKILEEAILEKGIQPALDAYRGRALDGAVPWVTKQNNWAQVCNWGVVVAALAIGDRAPGKVGPALEFALERIQMPMRQYAPDGGFPEGPGYWRFGTYHNQMLLAALQSAMGTDFGLSRMPGFPETGWFHIYMTGPLGLNFNFSDSPDEAPETGGTLHWMAREFDTPAFAAFALDTQRRVGKAGRATQLLWMEDTSARMNWSDVPLDRYFRHVEVATMRSSWTDPKALFVGFKAGRGDFTHAHLDQGSFVFDAMGQRWVADPGKDAYKLPGYFDYKQRRWGYYLTRAESHNTLLINPGRGPDQVVRAAARIERFESTSERVFAVADLTPVYGKSARRVERGIAMIDRESVLIQDEIELAGRGEVWWLLHTPARISLENGARTAVLRKNGRELRVRLVEPVGAVFEQRPDAPLPTSPDPKNQKAGLASTLAIHFSDVETTRIVVSLTPPGATPPPRVVPLADW